MRDMSGGGENADADGESVQYAVDQVNVGGREGEPEQLR